MEEKIESVWDFVVKYYPGYYQSDKIALADDLQKIMYDEVEEGSNAEQYYINECDENMEIAIEHYNRVHREIYEDAIVGWIVS